MVIGALPYWGKSASAFFGNQAVYEQDNDSADNRTYPAGAFAWLVEPQGATQVACHDSTDNTQDDGHDNAQFLVTRHNCPCKQTHDKANDDHADDAHGDPFLNVENMVERLGDCLPLIIDTVFLPYPSVRPIFVSSSSHVKR